MPNDPQPTGRPAVDTERSYTLNKPEGLLAHYTSAEVAFEHILPTNRLRMSPYRFMRDPVENKDIVPGMLRMGRHARTGSRATATQPCASKATMRSSTTVTPWSPSSSANASPTGSCSALGVPANEQAQCSARSDGLTGGRGRSRLSSTTRIRDSMPALMSR
jgi:hypothetical protein